MIFYDCSTAPNPRRARMFIAEKGVPIETREISIARGEQLSDDFRAVNPRATLPVLITQAGKRLTENVAIALYLEEMFPDPPLLGEGPEERAQVLNWNAVAEQQGAVPVAEAFRNANPHMRGRALPGPHDFDQIPQLAERGMARIGLFLEMLERRLQESPYLALDRFSLADISAFVFIEFARVVRVSIPESNAATLDWHARVKARPSASL